MIKWIRLHIIKPLTDQVTPVCEDITFLISKGVDTKLSFAEGIKIRVHNFGCILCHRYAKQLYKIDKGLRQLSNEELEIDSEESHDHHSLSPEELDEMKKVLKSEINKSQSD